MKSFYLSLIFLTVSCAFANARPQSMDDDDDFFPGQGPQGSRDFLSQDAIPGDDDGNSFVDRLRPGGNRVGSLASYRVPGPDELMGNADPYQQEDEQGPYQGRGQGQGPYEGQGAYQGRGQGHGRHRAEPYRGQGRMEDYSY